MAEVKRGVVAVIFTSLRNDRDDAGYAAASAAMASEAALQPGYIGMDAVRDTAGEGITISYWADEASALAWRAHAQHSVIRDRGRAAWYDRYRVIVAEVSRTYRWERSSETGVAAAIIVENAVTQPKPEATTGKTLLGSVPPAPEDGSSVLPAPGTDAALIESTSVQGASDDEETSQA